MVAHLHRATLLQSYEHMLCSHTFWKYREGPK